MPLKSLFHDFVQARRAKSLEKSEAARDYFEMAKNRSAYPHEYWQAESERLLRKAVGRKLLLFKTREGKALEEFMRLARSEMMKTPEMREENSVKTLMAHPLSRGLHPNTLKFIARLNSGGSKLEQIQEEGAGFKIVWREGGKLREKSYAGSSQEASELKKMFENARTRRMHSAEEGVLTAKHLGLENQVSLKEYIEKKHGLKWTGQLDRKLEEMKSFMPAFSTS